MSDWLFEAQSPRHVGITHNLTPPAPQGANEENMKNLDKHCDHILGICESRITDTVTGETLALVKQDVTASWAKYDGGNVGVMWTGAKYSFCPICGEKLGSLACVLKLDKMRDGKS